MKTKMSAYCSCFVTTRFISATDKRGSRIKAELCQRYYLSGETKQTKTFAYEHELDSFENHAQAAGKILKLFFGDLFGDLFGDGFEPEIVIYLRNGYLFPILERS